MTSILRTDKIQNTSSVDAITIHSTGAINFGLKPIIAGQIGTFASFSAINKIPFDDFWVQRGITYDSSTRRFTVPVSGIYRITMNPFSNSQSAVFRVLIGVNTDSPNAANHRGHCYKDATVGHTTLSLDSVVSLNANDYIVFYLLEGNLYNLTQDRFNQFSIEMIG
jgi:hypothetical protein